MAGTPGAAAEVAELVKVSEEIEEMRGCLRSCKDAQELSELRKHMTALREDRKALLEKEARLAGTAASEWGCNRAAGDVLRGMWQQGSHAGLACSKATHGGEHGLLVFICMQCAGGALQVPASRTLGCLPTSDICWCSGCSAWLACSSRM